MLPRFNKISADTFEMSAESTTITKAERKKAAKIMIVKGDYSINVDKKLIDAAVSKLGGKISAAGCKSLRQLALKDKIIKNYSRMNHIINVASVRYNGGENILTLSADYDFPPLNLLRGIFLQKGISIGNLFSQYEASTSFNSLSAADRENLKLAAANDAEACFTQKKQQQLAIDYENAVAHSLDDAGVRYKTERVLAAEQAAAEGRAMATPDFLLLSKVYYDGVEIKWIDVKHYFYYRGTFLDDKLFKQCAKYNERFGRGCLMFAYGREEDSHAAGCIFI